MQSAGQEGEDEILILKEQIRKLEVEQREEDAALARLRKAKLKLSGSLPVEDVSTWDEIPHYRNLLALVEDAYLLQLKEKSIKRELEEKLLSAEARSLGQEFLSLSISSQECVLKRWFEELNSLKAQQPDLLKLSSDPRISSSVHNIEYRSQYCTQTFIEYLSFTVLCETVNVRLKLNSHVPCSNKHNILPSNFSLNVCSDIHIPGLEQCVQLSIQDKAPVSNVVSHITGYAINDISPYVIGLPLKKLKKKKKAELEKQEDIPDAESSVEETVVLDKEQASTS